MLQTLSIRNIALIRELDLDLHAGMNVLTGETGAGKSILIDSIGLLTGAKADRALIRTGEDVASVSGQFVFLSAAAKAVLEQNDVFPDDDGNILVERYIYADGRGKIRVNGNAVSLAKLREISHYLLDIHGQTDTLSLYDAASYLSVLDAYADASPLLAEYAVIYTDYESVRAQIDRLNKSDAERTRQCEMLHYQIRDIDEVSPKPGEDTALEEKEKRIKNSERIYKQTMFAYQALHGAERGNAALLIERSEQALRQLTDVLPELETACQDLENCKYRILDIAERAHDLAGNAGGSPTAMIDRIESRLDAISKLKKKYGSTIEDIIKYRTDAARQVAELENADDRRAELTEQLNLLRSRALAVADRLHAARASSGIELARRVVDNLLFLDMPKVTFTVSVTINRENDEPILSAHGYDSVDFLISANQGEDVQSLSKVASGGELARIMLALKCVEQSAGGAGTMIFDEIDTGVSGKTARKIGMKLMELSRETQIICVTHSAQIASLADCHLLISKREDGGRTVTQVRELDEEGRIAELSRILGGIHVTAAQKQAAIDMRQERIAKSE